MPSSRKTVDQPSLPGIMPAERQGPSSVQQRMMDSAAAIYGEEPDMRFLHVVLAQCGLPYRELEKGTGLYEKTNGRASLVLTRGALRNPQTGRAELQEIPYGAKPRLLLIHLCTAAKQQKSPEIDIAHSMNAFMRELHIAATGGKNGSIARFKDQMNRLAATNMELHFQDDQKVSMEKAAPPIRRYEMWFPKSPDQRMLWPTTVTLSREFYDSLMSENALPLNGHAIRGLQQSAMALDIYSWLAHRLRRIPRDRPQLISWDALQVQFGPEYSSSKKFREDFRQTLRKVLEHYKAARVSQAQDGRLELRYSPPPIPERLG